MTSNHTTLSLQLAAADPNGICESQSAAGAEALDLDGDLVNGDGVAIMDVARRIAVTSAGDDSGISFIITGTDRYGRPLSRTIAGANVGTVYTPADFLTVESVETSAATAAAVTVGTNEVGSTAPLIADRYILPAQYGYSLDTVGAVTPNVEIAFEDLAPDWNLNENDPQWKPFNAGSYGTINVPVTMIRLTNVAGTGASTLQILTPLPAL